MKASLKMSTHCRRHDWDETLLELERFPGGSQRENCIVSYR